jgi:hypothetical protein
MEKKRVSEAPPAEAPGTAPVSGPADNFNSDKAEDGTAVYAVGRESRKRNRIFGQKGCNPLSAWSAMVAVPKSRGRQYRRNQRLFLIQSPGRYHVLTRLSGCVFVIMHVPLPALGQRQNISIQDTLQSNEISSIGLLFLLLIVALSIMCFLRGVVRYAYDRRLRNNKMTSAPPVTSSQESYVLKGESVISSNLVRTPPSHFISRLRAHCQGGSQAM